MTTKMLLEKVHDFLADEELLEKSRTDVKNKSSATEKVKKKPERQVGNVAREKIDSKGKNKSTKDGKKNLVSHMFRTTLHKELKKSQ